jgi:hypothetical protein
MTAAVTNTVRRHLRGAGLIVWTLYMSGCAEVRDSTPLTGPSAMSWSLEPPQPLPTVTEGVEADPCLWSTRETDACVPDEDQEIPPARTMPIVDDQPRYDVEVLGGKHGNESEAGGDRVPDR